MDSHNFFMPGKLFYSLINTFLITSLIQKALSAHHQFEACAPKNCGNGISIRYPFWLSQEQESYCGYPELEITCDGKDPVLEISDEDYIIRDVSYSNGSVLVAKARAFTDACPVPVHNFSFASTPFNYSFSNMDLHFFYHCNSVPVEHHIYRIPCASNTSHQSFAAILQEEPLRLLNQTLKTCQYSVILPVDMGGENDSLESILQWDYSDFLKKGFVLEWDAINCNECEGSGGRCGFDNKHFCCFCSDGPHSRSCKDELSLCADKHFSNCYPISCGSGPNISYPFWVSGRQEPHCGFPGFSVFCRNGEPIFNMSGNDYIIQKIFDKNHSVLVVNTQASDQNCPVPVHNLTLPGTRFEYCPAHVNLFLFLNCTAHLPTEILSHRIDCVTGDPTRRSLAFFSNDPILKKNSSVLRDCGTSLVSPVDQYGDVSEATVDMNYTELLRKGFILKWKASNCSECEESGGRCGFNLETHKFACFCPDRPHLRSFISTATSKAF